EALAVHGGNRLQRRLVVQFRRRIVVGEAPVKGATPFDLAFAALGGQNNKGRGIIIDRQHLYVDLVDAIGIAHLVRVIFVEALVDRSAAIQGKLTCGGIRFVAASTC